MTFPEPEKFLDMCERCQRFDLLNMINDAVILMDANDGRILFMNQRALAMYRYTGEEALTLSLADICNEPPDTVQKRMKAASRYNDGRIFTVNNVKKDGAVFKVEVSARFMTLHGKKIVASIARDLTPSGRMREEVEIAGKIQRRLLPGDLETDLFQMCSVYQPLNYVSGDFYDIIFERDKKILHGVLLDVMGHGLAAAAQTSMLKYLFQRVCEKNIPVNQKLAWMNNEVLPFFMDGEFAAAFIFEFDFKCNALTYSSGGINHFLMLPDKTWETVQTAGLFLGINENEKFDQGIIKFQSGNSFFFLTDGLFELLPRPMDNTLDFWGTYNLCKRAARSGKLRDDCSGLGILVR